MEQFNTVEEILNGGFEKIRNMASEDLSDRVLKSTKIEQMIFDDLYSGSDCLKEYETKGKEKLKSFDSLINDVFQSVYGLNPKYIDDAEMTPISRRFNKNILSDMIADEEYGAIKNVCEGKELPALSATEEFIENLLNNLSSLIDEAVGGKDKIKAIDKIQENRKGLSEKLEKLIERRNDTEPENSQKLDSDIVRTANRIVSKTEQAEMLENVIAGNVKMKGHKIKECVSKAAAAALGKASETQSAIIAWGDGDAQMQRSKVNYEILKRCANSYKLRYIAQFLGRHKEMLNSKRLVGYTYGRGEKYDIEYGNNISRTLTSDLSLLADPRLLPLFIRKFQKKALKQYRRRTPEYKGKGDIIVCLDESSSTFGENNAYGMSVAMLLYEICKVNKTNFALIHFSAKTKTDIFPKENRIESQKVLECAETFLSGGTNFDKPIAEAIRLVKSGIFSRPDIVFITDGECVANKESINLLTDTKTETGMKLTGILLDKSKHFEFSLAQFVDRIYRVSELAEDKIVEKLIADRI